MSPPGGPPGPGWWLLNDQGEWEQVPEEQAQEMASQGTAFQLVHVNHNGPEEPPLWDDPGIKGA